MKHPEGLQVTLAEQGTLYGSGILKVSQSGESSLGMPADSVSLFLAIAAAGDDGIAQNKLPKDLLANLSEIIIPLELQNLIEWQRDNRGRRNFLVLTWKGKDAMEAARTKPTDMGTWASRRKASVAGVESVRRTTTAGSLQSPVGARRRVSFSPLTSSPAPTQAPTNAATPIHQDEALDEAAMFTANIAVDAASLMSSVPRRRRAMGDADMGFLSTLKISAIDLDHDDSAGSVVKSNTQCTLQTLNLME